MKKLTPSEIRTALNLRKSGASIKSIAKQLHVSDRPVAALFKNQKKTAKPAKKSPSAAAAVCVCDAPIPVSKTALFRADLAEIKKALSFVLKLIEILLKKSATK